MESFKEPSQFQTLPESIFGSLMLYLPNATTEQLKIVSKSYTEAVNEVGGQRYYWIERIEELLGAGPSEDTYERIKGIDLKKVYKGLVKSTDLMNHAYYGDVDIATVLMAYTADELFKKTGLKSIAYRFECLAGHGRLDSVELFLSYDVDVNPVVYQPVVCALFNNHLDVAKLLIEKGADPFVNNNKALTMSARNGHLNIVEFLINLGADITTDDNKAVWMAAVGGNEEIVQLLIDNGADLTDENYRAMTGAAFSGNMNTIKLVRNYSIITLDKESNIMAYDDESIEMALRYGHLNAVKFFVSKGYGVDDALDYIIKVTRYRVGKYSNEVKISICNYQYREFDLKRFKVIEWLVNQGAHITSDVGESLWIAASEGNVRLVEFLYNYDPSNKNMKRAMNAAAGRKQKDVLKLLLTKINPNDKDAREFITKALKK